MKTIGFAILALGCALSFAHGDEGADWQHRPRFSDGEKAFQQARAALLKEYVDDKLTEDDLYRAAVAGMLEHAGGRKWDALLSPTEANEMMADMSGEVVGVGVEIRFDADSGMLSVLGVIPGSAGEKAGLAAGDKILKIDGKSFKGQSLRDAVYSIRGKVGAPVTLTLLRDDQIVSKTITREKMAWSPLSEMTLPGPVVVIGVRAFTEKTPSMLRATLERVARQAPRGIVFDLRGNEGGLFERLIDCAGLVLPRGKVVVTKVGRGGREEPYRTAANPVISGVPLLALIDGGTASSAEMFAAALKQDAGARLVGKRTRGKWNVQKVIDLPNHYALKYTVGLLKPPNGDSLDGKGLEPDLEVDMDAAAVEKTQRLRDPQARLAADPQLRAAVALLKL